MSTVLNTSSSGPAIPLSDAARTAYQDLYDTLEDAIEATADPGLEATLLAAQSQVDQILTLDDEYRLHADTALFGTLQQQIKSTNNDLTKLKAQIAAVASHVALAGGVLSAIGKVLTVLPGV